MLWETLDNFSSREPRNDAKRAKPIMVSNRGHMRAEAVGRVVLKPSSVALGASL